MSPDTPPEMVETVNSLDQAIEEFRQIKEQLKTGPDQGPQWKTVAVLAARSDSDVTA